MRLWADLQGVVRREKHPAGTQEPGLVAERGLQELLPTSMCVQRAAEGGLASPPRWHTG